METYPTVLAARQANPKAPIIRWIGSGYGGGYIAFQRIDDAHMHPTGVRLVKAA